MKNLVAVAWLVFLPTPHAAWAQLSNRTAQVISFRVEHEPLPIDVRTLIKPLSAELMRVFKMSAVEPVAGLEVRWGNENPFNKFKKLSKQELEYTQGANDNLRLKVEIEHRYNAVLGGLLKKSKRHVMRLKLALFASGNQRVWFQKKKASCCIDLGVDPEDESMHYSMDRDEFMTLYRTVIAKSLAKF